MPVTSRNASSGSRKLDLRIIPKSVLEQFGLAKGMVKTLEERMRPGNSSGGRFLGRNESLLDVLLEDQATLENAGLTYEVIADLLAGISTQPDSLREYDVTVNGNLYHVERRECGDHQGCPYGCGGGNEGNSDQAGFDKKFNWQLDIHDRGSLDFIVTNPRTGEWLHFAGLLIHLVRAHHFFEGKGTSMRTAPESIIKFFGLKAGKAPAVEIVKTPEYMHYLLDKRIRDLTAYFSLVRSGAGNPSTILDFALKKLREYRDQGLLDGLGRDLVEQFYRELESKKPDILRTIKDADFSIYSLFSPLRAKLQQMYGN